MRETPLRHILLTDAELDHTSGLLLLREGTALEVYGTAAVLGALTESFPLRRLLAPYAPFQWKEIKLQEAFPLEDGRLRAKAFGLGSKRPRYAAGSQTGVDWVVGYKFEDLATKGVAVYAPGIEAWTTEFARELAGADCAFLDGTFWSDDEMTRAGVGKLAAGAMGHLPISGAGGILERLLASRAKRTVLVHINNTNPILDQRSAERRSLEKLGIEVGTDGMSVEV